MPTQTPWPNSLGTTGTRLEADRIPVRAGWFAALGLWLRTLGYTLPATLHWVAFSSATIVLLGIVGGAGYLAHLHIHKYAVAAVATLGLVPIFLLWLPFVSRRMFRIDAGRVALFTELILTGKIDSGAKGGFTYGREKVDGVFGPQEEFHSFHSNLDTMLHHLVRTLDRVDNTVPLLGTATKWVGRFRRLVVRHTGSLAISYTLAKGGGSPEALERSSLEATCHIAHNGIRLLRTAVVAAVIEKVVGATLWLIAGLLAFCGIFYVGYAMVYRLPIPDPSHLDLELLGATGLWYSFIAAAVAGPLLGYFSAWAFDEVVMHPVSTARVLQEFHQAIENQPLPLEWAERIHNGTYAMDRLDWLSFQALGPRI